MLTLNLTHAQDVEEWEETDTILVGRISHVEGQLSRYDADDEDWSATTVEAPFGIDDLLFTEEDSRAEFIFPNNTWTRIDSQTRIQLVALDTGLTHADIATGTARFYNKSRQTEIKVTTPFGSAIAPPGAIFDLQVRDNEVKVIAIRKHVNFIHNRSQEQMEVKAGSSGLVADMMHVSAQPGKINPYWRKWNRDMDTLWANRMRTNGKSASYLPEELHTEAYGLDKHGVWERVYYNGSYYHFWRPVHVSTGWAPFTSGAWTVWHGDHVWIPHEPFGYVTHHYGNWVFTAGFWYWAPPVTRVTIRTHRPMLRIGFSWYPGRVGWLHYGAHVGWVPLAPYEPYYTHRHWGRRSILVTRRTVVRRPRYYRHHGHAVVIHRSHLYRSANYRHARVKKFSSGTIRSKFRAAPVMNRRVVKDYHKYRKRDRFKSYHRTHKSRHAYDGHHRKRIKTKAYSTHKRNKHDRIKHHRMGPARQKERHLKTKPNRNQRIRDRERQKRLARKHETRRPRHGVKSKERLKKETRLKRDKLHRTHRDSSVRRDKDKTDYRHNRNRHKNRDLAAPSERRKHRPHYEKRRQNSQRRSNISNKPSSSLRRTHQQKKELRNVSPERRTRERDRQWRNTQNNRRSMKPQKRHRQKSHIEKRSQNSRRQSNISNKPPSNLRRTHQQKQTLRKVTPEKRTRERDRQWRRTQNNKRSMKPQETRRPRSHFTRPPQNSYQRPKATHNPPLNVRRAPPKKQEMRRVMTERRAPERSRQRQQMQPRPQYRSRDSRTHIRKNSNRMNINDNQNRHRHRRRN